MYAAYYNSEPEVLSVIVDAGVDVKARNYYGCNALHFAAMNNNSEVIKFLLGAGIDVNTSNDRGVTPLIRAAGVECDNSKNISTLINAGADVNDTWVYRTIEGHQIWEDKRTIVFPTVLSTAIISNVENVKALIEAGVDVNQRIYAEVERRDYQTGKHDTVMTYHCPPLMLAFACGRNEAVKLLLDAGACEYSELRHTEGGAAHYWDK